MLNTFISGYGRELLIFQGESLWDVAPTGATSHDCLQELRNLAKQYPRNDWSLHYRTHRGTLQLAKITDCYVL
jgi:hypothetical protein